MEGWRSGHVGQPLCDPSRNRGVYLSRCAHHAPHGCRRRQAVSLTLGYVNAALTRRFPDRLPASRWLGLACACFAVMSHTPQNRNQAGQSMRLLKLIPDRTSIDFVGVRYYAFAMDGLLVLVSLIWLVVHGLNYGIDFTGGVLLEVKSPQTVNIGAMRTQIDQLGFSEA